jgi:DMSO/TMAO reductase YedYZ molybdopterin-dependent catalytic subunit
MNRREILRLAALSGASALRDLAGFPLAEGEQPLAFADTKPFDPAKPLLPWHELTNWLTPTPEVFAVSHYGFPEEIPVAKYALRVGGLVRKPLSLSLSDLKARPKREYNATMECSGNGAAGGLIGNSRWTGTLLAPILKEAGVKPEGIEAVFYCADSGKEKIRGGEYPQQFARSLSMPEALAKDVLLCYAMNGEPLTHKHGAPVRLVVPGWYGVAWVKWLNNIEIHDRRFVNRFMGRDYVTIRGEKHGEDTIWRETSVGRMNLKSVPARAVKQADGTVRVTGAAWSHLQAPVKRVEVRIDNGEWQAAQLDPAHSGEPYCWKFWTYVWKGAAPGEHTVSSRAIDVRGGVQPSPEDPSIALKKTYWEANQYAVRKLTV